MEVLSERHLWLEAGATSKPRRPYVGAHPFEEADRLYFFGRDREAARLANLIASGTLTVVYGESGVGKTSLLNARLPAELEKIEPDWRVISFSEWQPGFRPKLYDAASHGTRRPVTPGNLARDLLGGIRRTDDPDPVVVVFDQFEEYFLYHPDGDTEFEAQLAALCNVRRSSVRVVLSLRSDGLFLLDRLRADIPDIYRSLMLVEPLTRKGAIAAVVRPLEVYNEQCGPDAPRIELPSPASPVVQALVQGAEQGEIRRRLKLRSGGSNADAEGASHIVTPFLQLALEALWQEDIVNRRGNALTVKTLCDLAGVRPEEGASEAVGRLAQAHVDHVLGQFDAAEKRVCSELFEHMVTSSGAKIAVKPPEDLEGFLDEVDRGVAERILTTLASPGRERLLRKVAPGPRFEIVHDALGVPILDWVTRWRQEDTARQHSDDTRRLKLKVLGIGCAIALFVTAMASLWAYQTYRDRAGQISRLDLFASGAEGGDYRLRLLLLASSLSTAMAEPWRTLIGAGEPRKLLREILRRSPAYGGTFPAAGVSEDGALFARIAGDRLRVTNIRTGQNAGDYPLPSELSAPGAFARVPDGNNGSRLPRLSSSPLGVAVGFVAGLSHPVLYWRGLIFHWQEGDQANWHPIDLADVLPDTVGDAPGWIWIDFFASALQVLLPAPDRSVVSALRLRAGNSLPAPFGKATFPPDVTWRGRRSMPVLSPSLPGPDRDRFASLEPQPNPQPGQLLVTELVLGSLQAPEVPLKIRVSPPALPTDRTRQAAEANFAPSVVAFSDDRSAVAVRQYRQVRIVPLDEPERDNAPVFSIPDDADAGASATGIMPPTMAAVVDQDGWHFSWFGSGMIQILDGGTVGGDLERRGPLLLAGARRAQKLNFTPDGHFLILQDSEFSESRQTVRVWNLDPQRGERIDAMSDAGLIAEACKIAETNKTDHTGLGGSRLTSDEMITWLGNDPQPCSGLP